MYTASHNNNIIMAGFMQALSESMTLELSGSWKKNS